MQITYEDGTHIMLVGKKQALLGLDVSSSAVKLIELSRSGGRMRVESYAVEPLPVGAVVENSIADTELVGGAIKRVVAKAKTKTKSAAMAVAGATVITKVIQMPVGLSDAEMESQIALEADQYIPYPLDEVALDFRVLGPNPSNDNQVNVLLAGCRREQVEARTEALEIAGLKPLYIDVEAYAVERAYELMASQLDPSVAEGVIGIADVGANSTMVAALEQGSISFTREQIYGGRLLTEEIQKRYGLSSDEAGLAKKQGGLPDDYAESVLEPFCENLAQQVSRSLQFYYAGSQHDRLDTLLLAGGCAAIDALPDLLKARLATPVVVCNPFADMATGKSVNVQSLAQDAPALLIAAGLAMRGFESDGVNLLAWRDELRQRRQRSFVIGSALAASLAGAMVFAGVQVYDGQIGAQKQRNNFLSTEIARVEKQITEIESLHTLRGQLVDRMQVIQDLQGRRSGIVYVFDNLVTSLVDGSYYTSLNRTGDRIQLEGRAENNNRISNLMRSIEASAWFKDPNLTQVVAQKTGSLPNVFSLNVSLDDPNGPELADGGVAQ